MTASLLPTLQQLANRRGLVIASQPRLQEQSFLAAEDLAAGLRQLSENGSIEILSPLPFLVCKLLSWSGHSPQGEPKPAGNGVQQRPLQIEVPISSAAAALQQPEDGGAGEGEALLREVLASLGKEAEPDEFREILRGQDATLVRRCLRRVQATKTFRVSRAALFRSLLQKLSH